MGEPLVAQCLAEFIGTYLLVFTVGCNVIDGNPTWAVASIGSVLMVLIYALGPVSGAHLNPAVTIAILISRGTNFVHAASFIGAQLLGGLLAGFSYYGMYGKTFYLGPQPGFNWPGAMVAEVSYTAMLCFVVLNVACAAKTNGGGNQYFGLAIGFVILAGGYAAGGISGGAFNPAVALGIDCADKGFGMRWFYAYSGFEIFGAVIASVLFRVVRPQEFDNNFNPNISALVSEFIGTFYLVFTVGLNVLGGSKAPALSIAASLMCMIYALGKVSGAHFNPAVTLAILMAGRGKISSPGLAAGYIVVQILAGACAALVYTHLMGNGFGIGPLEPYGWLHVVVAEVVFTFVLCFVVLNVATTRVASREMFGLAIGFCVTAGGFAVGGISGGSLNPAVSIGIDVGGLVNGLGFGNSLVYSALEIAGGALAAGMFFAVRRSEYVKGIYDPIRSYGSA